MFTCREYMYQVLEHFIGVNNRSISRRLLHWCGSVLDDATHEPLMNYKTPLSAQNLQMYGLVICGICLEEFSKELPMIQPSKEMVWDLAEDKFRKTMFMNGEFDLEKFKAIPHSEPETSILIIQQWEKTLEPKWRREKITNPETCTTGTFSPSSVFNLVYVLADAHLLEFGSKRHDPRVRHQ